ncbi:MAG: YggT family protein [Arcobacteraceae bacterium]|jgi:YggT family protein|nr:YggT family protein [Arcobacteraceae bacterium]
MIDSLLLAFGSIVLTIISLYKWVIIISALLSWVQPDPYNPIVQMLYRLTEPVYAMLRRYVPTVVGGMDLAPLIIIFILQFLEIFLGSLFRVY